MKEKTIISTSTLLVSLITYWYARAAHKDAAPMVMIGAFVGSVIGEGLADYAKKKEQ